MFVKRALALVALVAACASAQEAEPRELQMKMKNNQKLSKTDPLWAGPKTIKGSSDIVDLAVRWATALQLGYNTIPTGTPVTSANVNPVPVVSQYACDPKNVPYKYKSGSGLAAGAQLLPTVSPVRADTCAKLTDYFKFVFLPGKPVPIFDLNQLKIRQLSKDVVSVAGNWYYTNTDNPTTPVSARVQVTWKKYAKAYINGQVYRNHWLIVDMHSSPLVNTCGTLAAALPNCAAQIDPVPSP